MDDDRYQIASVAKALKILKLFLDSDRGYTFTEILNESGGMNKSNVLRILSTLKSEGYLFLDSVNSKYFRGPVFFNLEGRMDSNKIKNMLEPDLLNAAKESGMIVHFTVYENKRLKIIIRAYPSSHESLIIADSEDGDVPLNATGAGKIFAAFSSEKTRTELINKCEFKRYTDNTITDKNEFLKVVGKVREAGYALNYLEHEEFLCCLTRPVFKSGKELIGALSFSGLKDMFSGIRFDRMNDLSMKLTKELSRRFDYEE